MKEIYIVLFLISLPVYCIIGTVIGVALFLKAPLWQKVVASIVISAVLFLLSYMGSS